MYGKYKGRIKKLVERPNWYFQVITYEFRGRFKKDVDILVNQAVPLSKDILNEDNR